MAKESKSSNDGCAGFVGGAIIFAFVVIASIPKAVWIAIGLVAGVGILIAVVAKLVATHEKSHAEAEAREKAAREAQTATEKQEREARVREQKQRLLATLGKKNVDLLDSALASVKRIAATEAARTGWLGDVDFTDDLRSIIDDFRKAHSLGEVAKELSALDKPSADDRKILTEARTAAANLQHAACERVALIVKCAIEAQLIDQSLRDERRDARTAEQRAELHAKLSAMLYGIEATPASTPEASAAASVMARVQAYREIKNQIQLTRDCGLR